MQKVHNSGFYILDALDRCFVLFIELGNLRLQSRTTAALLLALIRRLSQHMIVPALV